ncbi:hypothetical protein D3C87_1504930 [compost metagenome]
MVDGVAHDIADGARQGERVALHVVFFDLRFEGDVVTCRKRKRRELCHHRAGDIDQVHRLAPVVHLIVSLKGQKLFGGFTEPRDILHQALLVRSGQALYPGLHDCNRRPQFVRGIDQKTLPRLELLFEPLENAVEGNDQRNNFARHIFDGKLRTRSPRVDLRCFLDDGAQAGKRPAHNVRHGEKHRRQKNRQQGDINRIGAGKKRQKRRSCI